MFSYRHHIVFSKPHAIKIVDLTHMSMLVSPLYFLTRSQVHSIQRFSKTVVPERALHFPCDTNQRHILIPSFHHIF
ncbi:hypothetical protein A0H81_09757 [Grifola frondosa]|uniref:Uncharacterized protein n=1 Tax=Grifola frondosa TaxID=5627 RepID=A0A1C7M012_GRIFR|nr:hypothetical protein A0H81_09757 [Grifola frondosa]